MPDTTRTLSRTTEDFLYDAFYSAAIGGSVVALFFLLIDIAQGRPFFTPTLLGSVLFGGADAASVSEVRLDVAAYYSAVHMAAFGALGALLAFGVHQVEIRSRHPGQVFVLIFLVFEAAFLVASRLFMPGVNEVLGWGRVFFANLLAAASMTLFLLHSHNEDAWRRFRQVAHLG